MSELHEGVTSDMLAALVYLKSLEEHITYIYPYYHVV